MPDLPDLSVADVRNWTVDRYYERGEGYFHDDRIHRPRREGRTLKALCHGSQPNPYRVEVTLGPDGITSGSCSCPIGDGGRCKHAVALLLTWVKQPEDFESVEPLEHRLREQSTDQLIALIHRLIEREPSLESVLDFHLRSQDAETTVDVRDYAEQAFEVRGFDPYDSGYAREVAENLDPLLDRGRDHLSDEAWDAARSLFQTVAETVCDQFDTLHDEEGHLLSVIDTCGSGLGPVLAEADEQEVRSRALEGLLDIVLWDAEHGGYGAADAAKEALRTQAPPGARRMAADVLRANLPPPPDEKPQNEVVFGRPTRWDADDWTRQTLGRLLLDLEEDRLDPEDYLDLCRRTGLWDRLVDRLLERERLDEAADAAAEHLPDYSLTDVADRLVEQGADDRARALLENRIADGRPYPTHLRWLHEHALDADDPETALRDARRLFDEQPSIQNYERVRRAASPLDRWDTVRADVLDKLDQSSRQDLLVKLYLHEDDPDTALEIVEPFAGDERSWAFGVPFLVSVADAVADTHPDAAVALYEEAARDRIDQRGRSNYADAADVLQRAKSVYEENDALDTWTDVLDQLYDDELHRLPAARDEFEKAGLM
jgi:uncharacterized Zn finger protein